jgi:hypothetical protein
LANEIIYKTLGTPETVTVSFPELAGILGTIKRIESLIEEAPKSSVEIAPIHVRAPDVALSFEPAVVNVSAPIVEAPTVHVAAPTVHIAFPESELNHINKNLCGIVENMIEANRIAHWNSTMSTVLSAILMIVVSAAWWLYFKG